MMMQKKKATLYTFLMGSVLCFVLLVTGSAYAQCPDGITSLWALDEDVGNIFEDSVNGIDGSGALTPTPVAGIVDGAQQFNDGADTGINVAADDSFNWAFNASFSIEYWIRRGGDAFSNPIAEVAVGRDDGDDSDMQWWTGLWANGKAAFVLIASDGQGNGSVGTGEFLEGNDVLTDGIWHHIAVVRDAGNNQNRLYVDGVLNDSVIIAYNDPNGFESAAAANLNIGWLDLVNGFNLTGSLDEVAIYGRVLTVDEIVKHFNDELSYCAEVPDDDDDDDNGGGGGGGSCFIESLR